MQNLVISFFTEEQQKNYQEHKSIVSAWTTIKEPEHFFF